MEASHWPSSAMRLNLILALSLLACLTLSLADGQKRPLAHGKRQGVEPKRRKQTANITPQQGRTPDVKSENCVFRGITMYDKTAWSPKPCVSCLCSKGEVVCDQMLCPTLKCQLKFQPIGECCPVCIDQEEFSGDPPPPNDPADPYVEASRKKKDKEKLKKDEEERVRKKDAERKKRKKEKKASEKQRKLKQAKHARKKEETRLKLLEEEEERAAAEERKRKMEEQRQAEEERARKLEMDHREMISALEEAAERLKEGLHSDEATKDEDMVWLRGDVFEMPQAQPTKEVSPMPLIEPTEPAEEDSGPGEVPELVIAESEMVTTPLPQGCTISDVIVTCENAKLLGIPPLSIPELKSLNLQGNEIQTIPAGAFNGIPNLEWIDLGKNKISSSGIDPQAFKGLKFLSRLYMDGNLLEQIPPELPPTLQELKINENTLKVIEERSFEGLSSLVTLELEGNLLSEGNVNPNAFKPLKELNYLRLNRNHFRTIPQGLPESLLELYLESNLIEDISEIAFNHTTNINVVVLRHNKLDESGIAPLAWINNRNLESIDLSYNNLYLVPSFLPKSLVHLVLVGNQIERIPGYVFAHMEPGLEYLYLSYNKLDGDGIEPESFFGTLNTMTELCIDHNQLTAIPMGINEMTTLHFLRLNNNKIRHVQEESICDSSNDSDSHLVALRLENNFLDPRKIPPSAFSCVRSYSSVDYAMKVLYLLALVTLCHTKPYKPINVMEFIEHNEIMQQDVGGFDDDDDDYDDDDGNNYDDYEDNFVSDCPEGCRCSKKVLQCSDQGLMKVPKNIPANTLLVDLQNNDITEIKEDDFKGLDNLYALFLLNNRISKIHPKAFEKTNKLKILHLSYNLLTQMPENLPVSVQSLRLHDNQISKLPKGAFRGMHDLNVLELSANPIANSGIDPEAFDGMATLYLRIAESKLTAIPKNLPPSLNELHLDYNKIDRVESEDFLRLKNLQRLWLDFNQIKSVENGSFAPIPRIREVHLNNNNLKKVPPGLNTLKYLQVMYLHANSIGSIGVNDFCPSRTRAKKALYTRISLYSNPVKYWHIPPPAFRCVSSHNSVQLGNHRK
ncbi:hypothetical protein DNTS_022974 [Danionella cerebrum]|uniref:VWFC domain-containing protein n=1 Tax=Danionella cerebrum TaxID=2873325 RepID=A0A553RHF4_9TELE|nr:hypothetical protein DNTS_022974 [Danionella translucida]